MTMERPSCLLGLAWVWKHDSAPAYGIYGAVEKDASVPGRERGSPSIRGNSFEQERENLKPGAGAQPGWQLEDGAKHTLRACRRNCKHR